MVVYQSLWGNTAAVARAIGEGIGPGARVGHTGEITPDVAGSATLLVVGAPVHALSLPTTRSIRGVAARSVPPGEIAPDVKQPLIRDWLAALPYGEAPSAAFDTRLSGILGSGGTTTLEGLLKSRGRRLVDRGTGFIVVNPREIQHHSGMLLEGELARAREWGAYLAGLL